MKLIWPVFCVLLYNLSFAQFMLNPTDIYSYADELSAIDYFETSINIDFSKSIIIDLSKFEKNERLNDARPNFKTVTTNMMFPYAFDDGDKWYQTDTGVSLIVAGSLITAGTIMHFNTDFKVGVRDNINRYLPEFENTIDDTFQYLPYIGVFALDAAGIKSEHKTYRKLSTIGTSLGINLLVVQSLKYSIAEPRPDGSSNNSFPSGHTTTAFMGAHIFHKEYKHRSPYYSIAGYTLAAVTGVFRQLNNRHWISDVFAGAGIGIGATELAYFLNDVWWKEKGINDIENIDRAINELKPSFLGVKLGYASLAEAAVGNEPGIKAKQGFKISFEGGYFFNKNVGLGGEIGFQSFPFTITSEVQNEFAADGYELLPEAAGNRMYYFGPYYQIPFGKNAIGAKLHAGVISGPNTKLYIRETSDTFNLDDEEDNVFIYADYNPKSSFSWATGMFYKRIVSKSLSIGMFLDYNWADLKFSALQMDDYNNGAPTYLPRENRKINFDSYNFGVNLNIMLW